MTVKVLGGGAPCLGGRIFARQSILHNLRSCRQTNYSSDGTSALIQNALNIAIKLCHMKQTSGQYKKKKRGKYIFSSDGMKAVK
jgi:hypothetical protein